MTEAHLHQNRWNQFIYARWAPVYDVMIGLPPFVRARRRAFDVLDLRAGERLLIAGIGTGPDFPFLPEGVRVTGMDLSEPMLARARRKLPIAGREIVLQRGNAEALPFDDGSFDAAGLFLILSVAGDPISVLRETVRVLRPGGRVVIFDKFLPKDADPSMGRRMLNALITRPFGTDINRALEPMLARLPVSVTGDEASLWRGAYRIVQLTKLGGTR
jgi:ubiquinone/menaquinone biosynthesis C-methylase UbiE